MVEDGRDFLIYISYSLLNFPKIISKILPFATFFSFCYVLSKYELNNELIIFWNFEVNKIELINSKNKNNDLKNTDHENNIFKPLIICHITPKEYNENIYET
jgi:hypothetical protein